MERFVDRDLAGAEFRECVLNRARLVGVVMQDAEIDGLVTNLVVNGVEVTAYVEAELDRRHPVRVLIRSDDPPDLREGWRQLQAGWAATVERMRATPGIEHRRANDEWSAVQTLRHLVFVHDSWFRRCVLGSTALFTPVGLATDFVPDQEGQGLDLTAEPTLDEVLAIRAEQAAETRAMADVGDARPTRNHRARARRRRLAALRARPDRAPVPGHGAQRGVGTPRLLRARPRPSPLRGRRRWLHRATDALAW